MIGKTVFVDGFAVNNVLIQPNNDNQNVSDDITIPVGGIYDYTLYFPDDYTEDLYGKTITVNGKECSVIGAPDHMDMKSIFGSWRGCWDMVVRVQRIHGDITKYIKVMAKVITRDSLGKRSEQEICVYEGLGQVRFLKGDEQTANISTKSNQIYYFVFDWCDELNKYSTQQITIEYNNRTYDVLSIDNIDESSKYASIMAVEHV